MRDRIGTSKAFRVQYPPSSGLHGMRYLYFVDGTISKGRGQVSVSTSLRPGIRMVPVSVSACRCMNLIAQVSMHRCVIRMSNP